MAQEFFRSGISSADNVSFDAGLRAHMQRVFNYMGGGLLLTGLLAFLVGNSPLGAIIFGTPLRWLVVLAPLGIAIYMQTRMQSMSSGTLKTMFWVFCGLMGLSMGSLFMIFTGASIARAFFITSATFGAMSLYGYTTKRDLTAMGSFMMMGVLGLMLASVINLFLHSTGLQWAVSVIGVIVFTGLTAFDVQRIKQTYSANWGAEANEKLAVFSAMSLYLNFINAFQFILELTGGVRRS